MDSADDGTLPGRISSAPAPYGAELAEIWRELLALIWTYDSLNAASSLRVILLQDHETPEQALERLFLAGLKPGMLTNIFHSAHLAKIEYGTYAGSSGLRQVFIQLGLPLLHRRGILHLRAQCEEPGAWTLNFLDDGSSTILSEEWNSAENLLHALRLHLNGCQRSHPLKPEDLSRFVRWTIAEAERLHKLFSAIKNGHPHNSI